MKLGAAGGILCFLSSCVVAQRGWENTVSLETAGGRGRLGLGFFSELSAQQVTSCVPALAHSVQGNSVSTDCGFQ